MTDNSPETNQQAAVSGTSKEPAAGDAPEASGVAHAWLLLFLLAALAIALIWNGFGGTHAPFDPSKNQKANFALFAGFYVAAQVIERLLEVISPLIPQCLPGWAKRTKLADGAARTAQIKADRAVVMLGIASALGVAVSCGFGLYFLRAVGIECSRTIDILATGITIAAGTKPLHDFIGTLQKQKDGAAAA